MAHAYCRVAALLSAARWAFVDSRLPWRTRGVFAMLGLAAVFALLTVVASRLVEDVQKQGKLTNP
ncbi:hypothetical protein [Streptomyces bullii]|uniref:Uncharacterized protein n=1 Tax=Streptomyces bullii TaxID=349910 RepID=A0ABW0V0D5_9ACTN